MNRSAPHVAIENSTQHRGSATMGPVVRSAHVSAMGFALGLLILLGSYRTWLPSFCTSQKFHERTLYRPNDEDPDVVVTSDKVVGCSEARPFFTLRQPVWRSFLSCYSGTFKRCTRPCLRFRSSHEVYTAATHARITPPCLRVRPWESC
jgi:hypothetical protein